MSQSYICLNNKFYNKDQPVFKANRAIRFGDGLFETIRIVNGQAKYLSFHFERLRKGLDLLQINHSSNSFFEIETCINQLIIKNELEEGGILRVVAYRSGLGKYTPIENELSFYLETEKLEFDNYKLNNKGLVLGISKSIRLNIDSFSSIKTLNSIPYVIASKEKEESRFDELILLNNSNRVVEACSSNIFLVIGNKIITPPLSEGCIEGVMRRVLINKIIQLGITLEERPIELNELPKASEIFISNSISGIAWISAYESKRFFKKYSKQLMDLI